jgi:anti-sigma factor RsiW
MWSKAVIMTPRHIPFPRLVDLVEGRLPFDAQEQARAHVSACSRCAEQVAWLDRVIGLMRTDDAEDPPSDAIERVKRMFRTPATPNRPAPQQIRAVLRFDSAKLPQALGMRAGQAGVRQLLFYAEGYDLDLRITPADAMWAVSGQMLGPDASGQVELRGQAGPVAATLNDLSEFTLPPVPSGSYTLILHLADAEIEVIGLEIGG